MGWTLWTCCMYRQCGMNSWKILIFLFLLSFAADLLLYELLYFKTSKSVYFKDTEDDNTKKLSRGSKFHNFLLHY